MIIILTTIAIGYLYYSNGLPDIDNFESNNNKKIIQINFSNDEIITSFGDVARKKVEYYELPQHLINAVISIEDQKFFVHNGIDIKAIIRAFYVNQKSKRIVQGASTITQQLAKMLFLKPERTFKRKIQEIILAFKLEKKFSKEQILTMYLNNAYFGSGNYGVSSASQYYFDKDITELNLRESALIAALLKAPSKLSLKNDIKSANKRADLVINNMKQSGLIKNSDKDNFLTENNYGTNRLQRLYFADYAYGQFQEFINKDDLLNKKLIIKSSLNYKIQQNLENILKNFDQKNYKKLGKSEIAVIVMNKDGAILGMSGGRNYQRSQFNRAILSQRQAGSLFKTFVYLDAFNNGYNLNDEFEDKKIEFANWSPENYEKKYYGKTTLKDAYANSLNSVSIQLAKNLDRKRIINLALKLGVTSLIKDNDLTIALGTSELTLYELTNAYASIANMGMPVIPYAIEEITNQDGESLYKRQSSGFPAIVSQEAILSIKEAMREVVRKGTGKKANIGNNIYGKTGTSQEFIDAWFIGFNDDYVVGIWIGNDNNKPTNKITGGSLPAELFAEIIATLN